MMGTREPLKGGDEWDALTRARKYHGWHPGLVKRIKAKFWRRARKRARLDGLVSRITDDTRHGGAP